MGRPVNSNVVHGMASCVRYGCKLPECKTAWARSRKKWRVDRERGIHARVPAEDARLHGKALMEAGMSLGDMVDKTGFSKTTIADILAGRVEQIDRDTAEAILALPIPDEGYQFKHDGLVDALCAMRMLRALSANGFSLPVLAREVGSSGETIGGVRSGRRQRVRISLDRKILQAYERLWKADPVDFGISVGDREKAKSWAASKGWAPPAAWDDDEIRDPNAHPGEFLRLETPDAPDHEPTPSTPNYVILAEDAQELMSEEYRLTAKEAARRLGVSPQQLGNALSHYSKAKAKAKAS